MQTVSIHTTGPSRLWTSACKAAVAITTTALSLVFTAQADVVIDWSIAMADYATPLDLAGALPPTDESRAYAMTHSAMFQAILSANRAGEGRPASPEAAGAQAAHDVLVKVFADGATAFDALLSSQLAAIPASPAKGNGIAIGAQAAAAMLAARANDGAATAQVPYTPGTDPGDYQFTPPFDGPPFNGFAVHPNWGQVTPFVMNRGSQFRAPPPYKVADLEYTYDLNEIKALGSVNSTGRSADQTDLAIFWYESAPLGWNRIARILAAQHTGDLTDHARLFAILNVAMADTGIASFDSKYYYNFWRPITAIRTAATDGNNLTTADTAWESLLLTPPVPDYPSAHAAFGGAAATVLASFFGDENTFSFTSTMSTLFPTIQPRSFQRLSEAAKENAISRMLVGIHFRLATTQGYAQGKAVGDWVINHFHAVGHGDH